MTDLNNANDPKVCALYASIAALEFVQKHALSIVLAELPKQKRDRLLTAIAGALDGLNQHRDTDPEILGSDVALLICEKVARTFREASLMADEMTKPNGGRPNRRHSL